MTYPKPIETAPYGDGWILGLVDQDGATAADKQPWAILTRCDTGWADDEGYRREPRAWAPLPDPQPEPTGWRPAEGVIVIAPCLPGPISWAKWMISIRLPNGDDDLTREPDIATTIEEARLRAQAMSQRLGGLPIEEERPLGPRLAYSSARAIESSPSSEGPEAA